ncbi:palmdelphin-like isoform 2-T2 [Clarias gariepinus]
MIQFICSAIPDIPNSYTPGLMRRTNTAVKDSSSEAEKRAMFAMEISVEKDLRTGKSQVLSSATVTPQEFLQEAIKVYDDGKKSVYAVQSAGKESEDTLDELSPLEVEELIRKAAAKKNPTDVEYHEPVFSSRLSTPQNMERGMVSPGPNGFHIQNKAPDLLQPDKHTSQHQECSQAMISSISDNATFNKNAVNRQNNNITQFHEGEHTDKAELMQELQEHKKLVPVFDLNLGFERCCTFDPRENACFSIDTSSEMDCSEPVTLIFMGYQNAESDEENDVIQAELVVIGNDEEKDDEESPLSYHPQGYYSKVFQPKKDNLHRSEVRDNFTKNHSPEGQ